ncbi:MAG: PilN domain-containing protein [Acidobacteria bacterium]|nr:PilN domain-containing protein [Acidobacteriota bacterium]
MIRINLVSEGRGPRGGGAASAVGGAMTEAAPGDLNNKVLVGIALVGLILAGAYWFLFWSQRNRLENQAVELRAEAQALEKIIREVEQFKQRKADLELRINLINDLKKNQKMPVRVMDRVSQNLPDLLWLTSMRVTGTQVEIEGQALNTAAVAVFVENIKGDPLFAEPNVRRISRQGNTEVYQFQMGFTFFLPQLPEEAEQGEIVEPAA